MVQVQIGSLDRLLNRSGRLQPQPPQLETPTVPTAPPRSEDTAEYENDGDWDPLQMLVHVAAEAVPEKHTSTVVSSTEGDWRRQCGFLGFESLKSSEHALQDLCDRDLPSIRATMAEKGVVLVMPPFSDGGKQFSQEDMDNTFHIEQARIHVEKAAGPTALAKFLIYTRFQRPLKAD
ncbi:hypothetical protein HPB47_001209 [Ixodes persulcatus]|uniref:Uncharacterized protein n=1 Tax=Ixodes persulcatus TaxID=34615 RepID=A0AC60PPN7_IXOPE|nr:hypothetical protein HPB47_001209 [Ixodes persulcatus]